MRRRAALTTALLTMAVCVMPALRRVAAAAVPPTTRAAAPGRRAPFAAAAVPPARDPALPPFEWGVATASYQIEGAVAVDGRRPSIWDVFSHTPGRTAGGATGDVACDFYHKWRDDVALMADMGVTAFRFSLAWPRILPNGTGEVNQKGLDFYSDVVDGLLAAGIEPWVTLYHWDLPQALQDEYGGWESERIIPDFAAYARVAFAALGDRVTHWTTLNEPWVFSMMGYETGVHAPGRRGRGFVAARHALLAHAAAAAEFGGLVPGGRLSVNVNGDWAEPWDAADPADVAAAERSLDLGLHLFGDPLFTGQWPASVLAAAPPGAHPFSPVESAALRAAAPSYFALNFYTAAYVRDAPGAVDPGTNAVGGFLRAQATGPASAPIGDAAESAWLRKTPWAMRSMLNHVASRYGVPIVVTENGCSAPGEGAGKSKKAALNDDWRVDYYRRYLDAATDAVNDDGVPLRRYFAWSLLDNFEWADGYGALFGVTHVDFEDPARPRTLKASGRYLSQRFAPGAAVSKGGGRGPAAA